MTRLTCSPSVPDSLRRSLRPILLLALLLVSLGSASCGPSQEQLSAHATAVAADIYATQTAAVANPTFDFGDTTRTPLPTLTLAPTRTPTPANTETNTPAPTSTNTETPLPTATPIPEPDAVVVGGGVNVRQGPGTGYPLLGNYGQSEELDVAGRFGDCEWLQVSNRDLSLVGWVTGSSQYVELRVDCADINPGVFRPMTGVISPNRSGGGHGEFTVENGTAKDGLVVLTLDDAPVMSAYVRSEEAFTLTGIRDGTYYLFFSTGSEWNGKTFLVEPSYRKFEDAFPFTTGATTYTIWSVTLHGVAGGTAAAENVDPGDFPGLGN